MPASIDKTEIEILLLGCGFTARRVAHTLAAQGYRVIATSRSPEKLAALADVGVRLNRLDVTEPDTIQNLAKVVSRGVLVLHSIPTSPQLGDPTPKLMTALAGLPQRVVYISTTGVYGEANFVDENTPVAPVAPNQQLRVAAEEAAQAGDWSTLVLRPAAIYGPERGIHFRMLGGTYKLPGDGSNIHSRIHVDDLAAHCVAGLFAPTVTGAYPVADEYPCSALEVAQYCAELLHLPMPPLMPLEEAHGTMQSNRRVDGRAIRQLLGLTLIYPTYHEGITAALSR